MARECAVALAGWVIQSTLSDWLNRELLATAASILGWFTPTC
jgi:hypothetical protein